MKHTQRSVLAVLFVVGGTISYGVFHLLFRTGRGLPRLPLSSAPVLLLLAIALLLTAYNVNRRLEERRKSEAKKEPVQSKPMNPIFLARLLLLAKSAAHGGALLSGIYAGISLTYLVDLPHSNQILSAVLDTVSAILVALGGYILERVLTIKEDGKTT